MRKPTGRRFVFKDIPLTQSQRAELKRRHIAEAMVWEPPSTTMAYEEVQPDDSRYETAPVSEDWIIIE